MKIIKNNKIVCFDVDNTLITSPLDHKNGLKVRSPWKSYYYIAPIVQHVDLLKKCYEEGHTIIVWSVTGYEWVVNVCKALEITKYVTIMMGKPVSYVDDLDANVWMKRVYLVD